MEEKMKKLEEKIGKIPKIFEDLKEIDPEMYKSVMGLDQWIWAEGKLSKQTKKLIAIGIAAALRDRHAVRAQMAGASHLGITMDEIDEALRVTFLLAGMPAYVYGKAAAEELVKK
ncbi:MAG: carboxymuconolactone decarboxylase family protein [Methanomicrobiaceae archaeon]|nr:carboxymuconolactone decarboxylase family protein [Methanomicrobiaceae archaeon]